LKEINRNKSPNETSTFSALVFLFNSLRCMREERKQKNLFSFISSICLCFFRLPDIVNGCRKRQKLFHLSSFFHVIFFVCLKDGGLSLTVCQLFNLKWRQCFFIVDVHWGCCPDVDGFINISENSLNFETT